MQFARENSGWGYDRIAGALAKPRSREELFTRFRGLEIAECQFANLPETRNGRWPQGLTAAKMGECRWLLCRMRLD